MNVRMTIACTHQFTRPDVVPSSSLNVRRKVIMRVAMKRAMTMDSMDTVVPRPTGRTNARRMRRYRIPTRTAVAGGVRARR